MLHRKKSEREYLTGDNFCREISFTEVDKNLTLSKSNLKNTIDV